MKIAICISTFSRPQGLHQLLRSLAAIAAPTGADITCVIVNNDPNDPAPQDIASEAAAWFPYPISVHHEAIRGLSAPRNCALGAVAESAEWVAFIDDDSTADPEWLAQLVRVQRETGADVVTGPVVPRYESTPPAWLEQGNFFLTKPRPTKSIVTSAYTNNVLISVAFLEQHRLRFDLRFGRSGGEDSHFFARVQRAGAHMVWCQEAIVFDAVPDARAKPSGCFDVRSAPETAAPKSRDLQGLRSSPFIRGEVSGMDRGRVERMARGLPPGQNPPRAGTLQNGLGIRPRSGHLCPTVRGIHRGALVHHGSERPRSDSSSALASA